jgi:flagellar hook-length control protein FliK
MNEFSIKTTAIVDAPASKSNGRDRADRAAALAALANSFRDLVHRFGSNLDTGLNSIAEQRGITAVSETRKPSENYNDTRSDRDGGGDDHHVARDSHEPKARGRDDSHRNDHGDDGRRAPEAVDRGERPDNRQSAETNTKDDGPSEPVEKADRPSGDSKDGDNHAAAKEGAKSDSTGAEKSANAGQNGAEGKAGPATAATQQTDVSATLATIVAPTTGLEKAEAVATANAQGLADDGPANDTAKLNAAAGLAAAASNAKGSGVHPAETGAQQNKNAAAQQAAANGQNQNQAETATRGQAGIQQQAQQIARALGDDVRMQINVDVADEAESLTSRPMTTLAAGAAVGDQGKGQNQNGQQQTAHAATPGQAQAAVAGNAQAQNGQTQGQNQQANAQANQAQGIQQAGVDAKGPAAASTTAHNAGATTSGGSEGASSNSGVSGSGQTQQTQQSQHASQTQQAQAARGQHNGPSAAEQVSVRITRALQAGNDRISIRLNPAELGRVEVKVELSHDGRMTAVVTADKPETLETLRRDASELQKALQQGGIDLGSGDLAFNLRGEQGQTADGGDGNAGAPSAAAEEAADASDTNPEVVLLPSDIALGEGRVDVRA